MQPGTVMIELLGNGDPHLGWYLHPDAQGNGWATEAAAVMLALFRAADRMDIRFEMAIYNSAPALVIHQGDKLEAVFVFEVIDDVITNLYAMRNPDKLAGVTIPRAISRS